jgi:ABC-type antimicrobial peptide transport system permease subunit
MSYLAMSAAPIESDNHQNNSNDNLINKKKYNHTSHAKTQKQRQASSDFNPQKVNSVLQSIHNTTMDDEELGSYNPSGTAVSAKHSDNFVSLNPYDFPPKPVSVGGERTKKPEGMTNMENTSVPLPTNDEDLDLQNYEKNFMNDAQVRDYYRNLVPNYNHDKRSENNKNYYKVNSNSNNLSDDNNQVLIEKLNYMINLLEEQQDQKTNNVTEEVVLYSFLGVFIIFVVDSFARAGKYVR